MGYIGLVGAPFWSGSPLRAAPKGGAIPDKAAQGIPSVNLLLAVMPMRMTCLHLPSLTFDILSASGGR